MRQVGQLPRNKLFHFRRQWNLEKLNLTVLLLQWFYHSTSSSMKKCHICTTGLRNAVEDPTVKLYGLLDANITRTAMSTELNQSAWNSLQHRVSFLLRPWAWQLYHIKVCLSQDMPMTSYHVQRHNRRDTLHFTRCLFRTLCLTHNFRLFLSWKWSVSDACLIAVILCVFKNGRLRIRCCTDKPETLAAGSNGVRLCHLILQPQIGLSIQHC